MVNSKKSKLQIFQEALTYIESIVNTIREPLLILDKDMRIITASRSFYQTFKVDAKTSEGQLLYDLGNRQWDIPALRTLLEKILPTNTQFNDYEVERDFETIGKRTMLLNARRIYRETNKTQTILLAIEDITERKKAEVELKKRLHELEIYYKATVNRELRMVELKKENKELKERIAELEGRNNK